MDMEGKTPDKEGWVPLLTKAGKERVNQFQCPICSAYRKNAWGLAAHIAEMHPTVADVRYAVVNLETDEESVVQCSIMDLCSSISSHGENSVIGIIHEVFADLNLNRDEFNAAEQELVTSTALTVANMTMEQRFGAERLHSLNTERVDIEEQMVQIQMEALRRIQTERVEEAAEMDERMINIQLEALRRFEDEKNSKK